MRSGARRGRERRQALVGAEGREAGGAGRLQAGWRHRWEEKRRREAALVLGGEVHGERGLCLWRGLGRLAARRREEEAAAASVIGADPVLVHGGGVRGGGWD